MTFIKQTPSKFNLTTLTYELSKSQPSRIYKQRQTMSGWNALSADLITEISKFWCPNDFAIFSGIPTTSILPEDCWWTTGHRRYRLAHDGGNWNLIEREIYKKSRRGFAVADGMEPLPTNRDGSRLKHPGVLYIRKLDQVLYHKFNQFTDLIARQTSCAVAQALQIDHWSRMDVGDCFKTSRIKDVKQVFFDNGVLTGAGEDTAREVFRANNQWVTNATTAVIWNDKVFAVDLVCTHSEDATEFRVEPSIETKIKGDKPIISTEGMEAVQQAIFGTNGLEELSYSKRQTVYFTEDTYKGPLASRGQPNQHLLLQIFTGNNQGKQSKKEIIWRSLVPLSWRISLGARMFNHKTRKGILIQESHKLQGTIPANNVRLGRDESRYLAYGDCYEFLQNISFVNKNKDKICMSNLLLVPNDEVTKNSDVESIMFDEATVYFHVGIQESRQSIHAQRNVAEVCKNTPWKGIILPRVVRVVKDFEDDVLQFQHTVSQKGMFSRATVYNGNILISVINNQNSFPTIGICAQDIYYL